jgi:L-asparaginase II
MGAQNPVLARVWRGDGVESVHRGVVAVMRGADRVYGAGDTDAPQWLRSTAKPFQALTAIGIILGSGFELSDAEVAVIGSSHGGQPLHVDLVKGMLARAGIPEERLQCGSHAPIHGPSAAALVRAGERPSALHNNCSGKHAAMLIAAQAMRAPLDSYLDPAHPLQRRNLETLARFAEVRPADVRVAVDGCSAPTFALPAHRLAAAFANLVAPAWRGDDDGVRRRFLAAVAREPLAYCGEGRTCTKLLVAAAGALVPKVGAEGVYALGVPADRLGIVTKIDDGSHRPTEALVCAIVLRVARGLPEGTRAALERLPRLSVENHRGLVVGRIEVTLP